MTGRNRKFPNPLHLCETAIDEQLRLMMSCYSVFGRRIMFGHRLGQALATGRVTENARERIVAVEKAAVERGLVDSGGAALEELSMTLFTRPQFRRLRREATIENNRQHQPRDRGQKRQWYH